VGNVLCVSFAVCFVEECREIAHGGQVQRNQRHGETHTHTERDRENSNPSVLHAPKHPEMFADFPIIVKLHRKIVVSYMSLEAIAIGFYDCMIQMAVIDTISKGKKQCRHCSRNWRVCWKSSIILLACALGRKQHIKNLVKSKQIVLQ